MYKAPDSVNAKSTASARPAYVKIHPNGQVIFGSAFITHKLVSDKEGVHTYFNFQYISSSKIIIVAFANEDEMLGQVENLLEYTDADWEKGVQCLEDGGILWRLTGGDLKKGLTGTIRSINEDLLPEKGYVTKWNEGKDLTIHVDEKYVELACKGKKPEPNSATQAELEKQKADTIAEEEEFIALAEMKEAYMLDVASDESSNTFEKSLNSEKEARWKPYLDKFLEWAEGHDKGRLKVATLKASFKESFSSALRVYGSDGSREGTVIAESETLGVKLVESEADAIDAEESPA